MTKTQRNIPVHPGRILERTLQDLEITPYRLAKSIGVPANRITMICAQKRGITADTAVRLATFFGTTVAYWVNMQKTYELQMVDVDEVIKEVTVTLEQLRRA